MVVNKWALIEEAKAAALETLRRNAHGPFRGLPRTASWGYPEPYTRDLMIASLGTLVSGDAELVASLKRVLQALAKNQTRLGHIPSLAHDPGDLGASDTTPLFLLGLAFYRMATGRKQFLAAAARKALTWMSYQCPDGSGLIAQQPTSDWRDEQWVLGFGLFVNALHYASLRLYGRRKEAARVRHLMNLFEILGGVRHHHVHEGLTVPRKPYYALWSYKVLQSERFDLLGNSLAILTGIASPTRSRKMVAWVEEECEALRGKGLLAGNLPPCFFPYMLPGDPDWNRRDAEYNQPGEYHNGGVWPFVCGFYVASLVAAGRQRLAEKRLLDLAMLVGKVREAPVAWGFNEWFKAQDGSPRGQDGQTWSAAMFLYAARCVETRSTPFFDEMRNPG
jgi:hypothetical protein